ncbi:MAG: MTAP family purine nucleoside phosphorylase [Thermoplasmata archaeon]|nr:MAG: MTAP family purine nucleoside phosphorylase [Thermoplasmata archaeon]
MLGIIAGSRVANVFEDFTSAEDRIVTTPYGAVTVVVGEMAQMEVAFLTRHGHANVPPHKVPYLTNMWALADVGVDKVVATSAVRSLSDQAPPGTLCMPKDYVDLSGRNHTFHGGAREGVYYADMTDPFCPRLRTAIDHVARSLGTPLRRDIKVLNVSGPAQPTAAEAAWYRAMGADVMSMTVATEAKLAREKGLCYQPVLIPYNWASGINHLIEEEQSVEMARRMRDYLIDLLTALPPFVDWPDCGTCWESTL